MNDGRRVHVALHDVAPFHLDRVRRAEALMARAGVEKATFLLVPDFHHRGDSAKDERFVKWCRGPHPFEIEWALHGLHHLEENAPEGGSMRERFDRAWMTGGEGEFLAATVEEADAKLKSGKETFRAVFGRDPSHFVPPAWLWREGLPKALAANGLRSFEAHRGICAVGPEGDAVWLVAPVISWATRTLSRRLGSLVVCPALAALWRDVPLLRVALHPHDFDWSATAASVEKLLEKQLRLRAQTFVEEALADLRAH